jgi:hypothetical protein
MKVADASREEVRPETVRAAGPLEGGVLELDTLIAGPFTGRLLGDLGAEVINVEAPSRGDPMRDWGAETYRGKSLWWSVQSRNEKLVTLDLRTDDLVYLLEGMGCETGIDMDALISCSLWLEDQLGRDLPGRLRKGGDFALV